MTLQQHSELATDAASRPRNPSHPSTSPATRSSTSPSAPDDPRDPSGTVSSALAAALIRLGVQHAFGVSGGAMAQLWGALSASAIDVVHCHHESGAGFAATEAALATGRPTVVFTTTGPGLTNALTGVLAARSEGAHVLLISASTASAERGRGAIQETHAGVLPGGLYTTGPSFDLAALVESAAEVPSFLNRLAAGWSRPGGFVAHLSLPTHIQGATAFKPPALPSHLPGAPSAQQLDECARLLTEGPGPIALWVGYGARHAAREVAELARRLGAAVLASPRAKGVFPERDPQFVGVTGMGGHATSREFMTRHRPARVLVLGTRLGQPTSFFHPDLVPDSGFIHVDQDPEVFGVAYPAVPTVGICADIPLFLTSLLQRLPEGRRATPAYPHPEPAPIPLQPDRLVRPQAVMAALQQVIDGDPRVRVIAETGNSFAWTGHLLLFDAPHRYRVSTSVGSMGHAAAGVVGLALATGDPSIAVLGDGAMLMNSEVNTAAKYGAPAIWVVLNDGGYGMCRQGMATLGMRADADFPQVDFVQVARGMRADGETVRDETELPAALQRAVASGGPYVVDVLIDPDQQAPAAARNEALRRTGDAAAPSTPPAAERSSSHPELLEQFPVTL